MDIRIDRGSTVPMYLQIRNHIKEMILAGELPSGFRLPPERHLASALRVNRSTVLNAYGELKADGLVDAHVGRGTVVLSHRFSSTAARAVEPILWQQLGHSGAAREEPLLRDLLQMTEQHGLISLSIGLPAKELIPISLLRLVHDRLLTEIGPDLLLHSPTEGVTALREAICRHVTSRGIRCTNADVLITSGSQQGLDLVARAFVDPGDVVVVEEPSYFGALRVFRSVQAKLIGIPIDSDGLRTDMLESLLARMRPKLIYTLPTFQNPSGAVMSLARRRHLLDLAYRYQLPVIEDDPYFDLRYAGTPVPPLKALDTHGHVLYLSSFSKVLFPGLRIGFLVAPRAAIRRLALAKQSVDLHSNTSGQWILQRIIDEGHYDAHLRSLRTAYSIRLDAMDRALRRLAPPSVQWSRPEGGFYFWCRIPDSVAPARLMAAAAEESVVFLPGSPCFVNEPAENFVRLNFSHPTPSQIARGVKGLMRAMRKVTDERTAPVRDRSETPPLV